jgi:hypothetical protein
MTLGGGYTVGVYVGFDDNRPMVHGSTRIAGSTGSLPTWSDIADTILASNDCGDRIDIVDATFNGLALRYPAATNQVFVPADPENGGRFFTGRPVTKGRMAPTVPLHILSHGQVKPGGLFVPQRTFSPFGEHTTAASHR